MNGQNNTDLDEIQTRIHDLFVYKSQNSHWNQGSNSGVGSTRSKGQYNRLFFPGEMI